MLKELIHARKDHPFDVAKYIREHVGHRTSRRPYTLAERYVEGELSLHLHIRSRRIEGPPHDFCAVLERGVGGSKGHRNRLTELAQLVGRWIDGLIDRMSGEDDVVADGPNGMQDLVLIDAREFVEVPQPMVLRGPADLKRLQLLDNCPVFLGEIGHLVSCSLGSKEVDSVAYREGGLPVGGPLAGKYGELPDEVIERRPGVLQTIPDDHSELQRRAFSDVSPVGVIGAIRLSLVGDDVRLTLQKGADPPIEFLQVLVCSRQLGEDAR